MSTRSELDRVTKEYNWTIGLLSQQDLTISEREFLITQLNDIELSIEVLQDFISWDL